MSSGKVWLVGAGPGDKSLITVKGLELLKRAEVLVYDRLVNAELLDEVSPTCIKINVGKAANHHPIPQDEINAILVREAQKGLEVVRLKCGDPFVFGRGGEEAAALTESHIDYDIVPGVTSAIGGLAYAGIPVTHRDYASSFHVITGHASADKTEDPINWEALAQVEGTLVFLMGVGNLKAICDSLIHFGKDEDSPVAIVMNASFPNQRTVTGSLKSIVHLSEKEGIKPPALVVVGDVVRLHSVIGASIHAS